MQERKKKYMLKVDILGVKIYICNLNLKPYTRALDNRCADLRRASRQALYDRAGGKCEYCGREIDYNGMQLHHVVPASMNGTNNPHNLMCLCSECHHLIHGNAVVNHDLIEKKLREHPEVRKHGAKHLYEEVKENRKRKVLHKWKVPGVSFMVIQ